MTKLLDNNNLFSCIHSVYHSYNKYHTMLRIEHLTWLRVGCYRHKDHMLTILFDAVDKYGCTTKRDTVWIEFNMRTAKFDVFGWDRAAIVSVMSA